jgi:ABC-2 type transport system ATP-binding protein
VWSHHTKDAGFIPAQLVGEGSIDIKIPSIPLQPGTFEINTSVVDDSLTHSFDQWGRGCRLDVLVGTPRESGGLVVMNSNWTNLQPPTAMALDGR